MSRCDKNSGRGAGRLRRWAQRRLAAPGLVALGLAAAIGLTWGATNPAGGAPKSAPDALAAMLQSYDKVEVQEHPWGWIRWLMNSQINPESQMTFGVVQINAGQRNPLHMHANCEEVLYMLSGSCEHRIGDRTVVLKPGDLLRVPTGVSHAARVIGDEPVKAVIVYSSGDRQFALVEE